MAPAPWDRLAMRAKIKRIDPSVSSLPGFPGTPVGLPGQASSGVLPGSARPDHVHTAPPAASASLIQPTIFIESTVGDTVIESAGGISELVDGNGNIEFDFGGTGTFAVNLADGPFDVNNAGGASISTQAGTNINLNSGQVINLDAEQITANASAGDFIVNVSGGQFDVHVEGNDAVITSTGLDLTPDPTVGPPSQITMQSPDGHVWTLQIDDSGAWSIT